MYSLSLSLSLPWPFPYYDALLVLESCVCVWAELWYKSDQRYRDWACRVVTCPGEDCSSNWIKWPWGIMLGKCGRASMHVWLQDPIYNLLPITFYHVSPCISTHCHCRLISPHALSGYTLPKCSFYTMHRHNCLKSPLFW